MVRRGEIYLMDLSSHGGTLKKNRPVLVVQNDAGNMHSMDTIVAGIRDGVPGKMLPVFVRVARGTGGLTKDSVIDCAQLATVAKRFLNGPLGKLPPQLMDIVDRALEVSLDLETPPASGVRGPR